MDAVSSALHVAAGLGLEISDPKMLRSTNNTVLWLQPSPVLAKVAPAGKRLLVEWEFVVASAVGRMEAPVVPPFEPTGSVVHHYDG